MTSPPPLSWSELDGAAVGLWGLGVEGRASLRRLLAMGTIPVLVDDRPTEAAVEGLAVVGTQAGGLEALARCDVVVKAPGISRYRAEVGRLADAGVPVTGGLALWLAEADLDRVLVVTGTKGKSTTAALAGHLASGLGRTVVVGGNIGRLPYDPAAGGPTEPDLWVVEVSSFQATDLSVTPPVVVVTSLAPDHLDWHGDAETYFADKLSATSRPGADLTVADATSPLLVARRSLLGPRVQWVEDRPSDLDDEPWIDRLGLPGAHNRRNARLARAGLTALGIEGADDDRALADAATGFEPLPHRLETVGRVDGVDFVDDSLSTNVLPTRAALAAFGDRPVALVVGGFDRGLDYGPLGRAVAARRAPTMVLTVPDNGRRIGRAVAEAAREAGVERAVVDCDGLGPAVAAGFSWARPGGVVLLSPAAPSFGHFQDYQERGRAFAEAVARCAAGPGPA
jgi:UDP-N-acetylmuramoylalanine--D-glutamate ligase